MNNPLPKTKGLLVMYWRQILLAFVLILSFSLAVLYGLGWVPAELDGGTDSGLSGIMNKYRVLSTVKEKQILPSHISIPQIGVNVSVSNPDSDNVDILDEYLKSGAVRYPGSGALNIGNMFLFAHSTSFKVVHNQAYKAFNDLKSLKNGDEIEVLGENEKTYVYKVSGVKLASDKDVLVRFDRTEHMLTLSTCNTFGKKEERYVVEAYFDRMK